MTELRTSTVHRNLDAKLKVVGMEVHDLLFVLIFAAVMNLLFGRTGFALYLVFLLPMAMAVVLFLAKRNKPDQFLVHFIRYHTSAGFFAAGASPRLVDRMGGRIDGR